MLHVLDSNYLRDPSTSDYLAASPDNQVVLTDYLGMEAYKSGSITMLADLLSRIAEFPRQVVILRGTRVACCLEAPAVGTTEAPIDRQGSATFPNFCEHLYAETRDDRFVSAVNASAEAAVEHLDALSAEFADLCEHVEEVAKELPASGLRQLRSGLPLSEEMGRHMQERILLMARWFFRGHNVAPPGKAVAEYGHRFAFRHAVVAYLMTLGWISTGGAVGKSPDKFRNDAVDSVLVTYATYFDGILSHDHNLTQLYENAVVVLDRLFGVRVGPL